MRLIDADALIEFCAERWIPLNVDAVNMQPTIQPEERTEERTESHACDLISLQAAVELVMKYCPDDDGAVQCDGDIRGLLDELENLPPAQPEEAISVSWIEGQIERLNNMDNYFAKLTADIIKTMLNEWSKRRTDD